MTAPVTVTTADREAAAKWARAHSRHAQAANMLRGSCDTAPLVQAFARHRQQAEAASSAREQALVEALRWALAELNGTTRYDNEEQRNNCFADAEAALARDGLADATAPWWQWYHAIDDALVCAHIGTAESFPDAKTALHRLICWEIDVALDPRVSERARSLIADNKAQEDALRDTLTRVATALPVLERMLAVAGLDAGLAVAQELGAEARALLARAKASSDGEGV